MHMPAPLHVGSVPGVQEELETADGHQLECKAADYQTECWPKQGWMSVCVQGPWCWRRGHSWWHLQRSFTIGGLLGSPIVDSCTAGHVHCSGLRQLAVPLFCCIMHVECFGYCAVGEVWSRCLLCVATQHLLPYSDPQSATSHVLRAVDGIIQVWHGVRAVRHCL